MLSGGKGEFLMDEPKTYDICTLGDFAKVPPDRLDACLADFKGWLGLRRHFDDLNGMLEEAGLPRAIASADRFAWIDDGKVGVRSINLTTSVGAALGSMEFSEPVNLYEPADHIELTVRLSAAPAPDSEGGTPE